MEKIVKSSDERRISWGSAYIIPSARPDHLVGRVLTIIEAMGLPTKQEESLKDLIKQEIYRVLELDTYVPGRLHTLVKEIMSWAEENASGAGIGSSSRSDERMGFMPGKFEVHYKEE